MKTYKFNKTFWQNKEEVKISLPEDLKWAEVNCGWAHRTGQVDYVAIIPTESFTEEIKECNNVSKYSIGTYTVLKICSVDKNPNLNVISLDELNSQYDLTENTVIEVNEWFEITYMAIPKRINKSGEADCDIISLMTTEGTPMKELYIDGSLSLSIIEQNDLAYKRKRFINNSYRFKEIYYSIFYKILNDAIKPTKLSEYIDGDLDINYPAELAKQLKFAELNIDENGKMIVELPKENEIIKNEIYSWFGLKCI